VCSFVFFHFNCDLSNSPIFIGELYFKLVNMNIEIWKIIEDAPKYEISNFGRIRNIKSKKIRKCFFSKGYPAITLQKQDLSVGRKSNHLLHRLIAKAFINNPNNYFVVNHIDGDPKNYNINNLEWCNQKENLYHSRNISKNGAVISRQKILNIYNQNSHLTKDEFLQKLISNCK